VVLLVRIVEFIVIIAVIRTFIRMVLPANPKPEVPRPRPKKTTRFDGKEYDISDADYEEVN
jgi:hypothetical protein